MILDEMDGESLSLMGAHGYCSQEMVNLLLTGQAVSNTFDGQILLKENGIISQSNGFNQPGPFYFLSLFLERILIIEIPTPSVFLNVKKVTLIKM